MSTYFRSALLTGLIAGLIAAIQGCDYSRFEEIAARLGFVKQETAEDFNEKAHGVANAEIFQEMYRTVLVQELKSREVFVNILNTLNQGASLEGVYNGLVHSANYRGLEKSRGDAKPASREVFVSELVELEKALPIPSEFTPASALPLPPPVQPSLAPDESSDRTSDELDFPAKKKDSVPTAVSSATPKIDADAYQKLFLHSSIYTLKRVLGDEALKVISEKRKVPGTLAAWYSKWVVRLCARNVDFGLALRNRADEAFHLNWAQHATDDQLTWEVLNRVHRILNEAERRK